MQIRSLDRSNLFLFFEKIYDGSFLVASKKLPPNDRSPRSANTRKKSKCPAGPGAPRAAEAEIFLARRNLVFVMEMLGDAHHSISTLIVYNTHLLKFKKWTRHRRQIPTYRFVYPIYAVGLSKLQTPNQRMAFSRQLREPMDPDEPAGSIAGATFSGASQLFLTH